MSLWKKSLPILVWFLIGLTSLSTAYAQNAIPLSKGETAPYSGILITEEGFDLIDKEIESCKKTPPDKDGASQTIEKGERAAFSGILIESDGLQTIIAENTRLKKREKVLKRQVESCSESTSFLVGTSLGVVVSIVAFIVLIIAL